MNLYSIGHETYSGLCRVYAVDYNSHRDYDLSAWKYYYTGDRYYLKNGNYHRDNNKTAIIYENGTKVWYIDDVYIKEEENESL